MKPRILGGSIVGAAALSLTLVGNPTVTQAQATETFAPTVTYQTAQDGNQTVATKVTTFRSSLDNQIVATAYTSLSSEVTMDGPDSEPPPKPGTIVENPIGSPSAKISVTPAPLTEDNLDQQEASFSEAAYKQRFEGIGLAPRAATGGILASDCVKIDHDEYYWRGCFERRRVNDSDPNYWYVADSSVASGHHVGFFGGLTWGKTSHWYWESSKPVLVTKNSPASTIRQSCTDKTIGFSAYGASYSETFEACPEKIVPTVDNEWARTVWNGAVGADDDVVSTALYTLVRIPNLGNSVLVYHVSAHEDDWR